MKTNDINEAERQRAIHEALASVPAPIIIQKKKSPFIIPAIASIIVVITLVAVVMSLSSNRDSTIQNSGETTNTVKASDRTAAYREIAPSSTVVVGFTATVATGDLTTAKKNFLHEDSPLYMLGLSASALEDYAGPNTDWETCKIVEQDSYRMAQYMVNDTPVYDIVYVPVQCSTTDGGIRELEFDVRTEIENSIPPKIFDIIARLL